MCRCTEVVQMRDGGVILEVLGEVQRRCQSEVVQSAEQVYTDVEVWR